MRNPTLTSDQTAALAEFVTKQVKKFDPNKGTLGSFMRISLKWWFERFDAENDTLPEYNVKNVHELMVAVTKGDPLCSPEIGDIMVREEINGLDGITIKAGKYKEGADAELGPQAPDVRISMNGETFYVRHKDPEDKEWSEFREFYDYESIVSHIYQL
jgi:hypothetical protein